nr:hypothetical protein [Tanacetum cinerariifolium]
FLKKYQLVSEEVLLVRNVSNIEPLVFFLATKDETSPILKTFITGLKNQLSLKVKVIRNDNETEFKNSDLNQFYSLLPIPFWAEEVNNACYVQNTMLVTKPHNKTPYELLHGRTPSIGFMRPFGCSVTILNTLDPLDKFKGKVDEGFLVGYSVNSKAFRVFNSRTRIVQETLHNKDGDAAFDGKQDDKTKKKAKGKSSVESFTGNRDLSAEFEDHSDNSSNDVNTADASQLPDNPDMLEMEDITYSDHENVGAEADFNNLETSITEELLQFKMQKVCVLVDLPHGKRVIALKDPSWIEAMQEELLQFKMQKLWILVDLPYGKKAISTKWVYRNKKDDRDIVVRIKQDLSHKDTHKRKESTMKKSLL